MASFIFWLHGIHFLNPKIGRELDRMGDRAEAGLGSLAFRAKGHSPVPSVSITGGGSALWADTFESTGGRLVTGWALVMAPQGLFHAAFSSGDHGFWARRGVASTSWRRKLTPWSLSEAVMVLCREPRPRNSGLGIHKHMRPLEDSKLGVKQNAGHGALQNATKRQRTP
jgi:hypothetical protein